MKQALGTLAVIITFAAFVPYIQSVRRGQTRPHVFSWVIWSATTFIVFLAQLADGGGAGAWSIGLSGLITGYVALLAYLTRADTQITRSDWAFFVIALSSLPTWYLAGDPLWAVVILTTIDLLGFGPTYRKAYVHPYDEQLTFYALFAARNLFSIFALEHHSLTTWIFPVLTGLACAVFVALVLHRRRRIAAPGIVDAAELRGDGVRDHEQA